MSKEFETLDRDLMVEVIRRKQCPNLAPSKSSSFSLFPESELMPPDPFGDFGGSSLRQDLEHFLDSSQSATFADISLNLGSDTIRSHKATDEPRGVNRHGSSVLLWVGVARQW